MQFNSENVKLIKTSYLNASSNAHGGSVFRMLSRSNPNSQSVTAELQSSTTMAMEHSIRSLKEHTSADYILGV